MSESKIIDAILSDASQKAMEITGKANKEAQEKLLLKKELLEKEAANKKLAAEREAQNIIESAKPSSEISVRNAVLKAKRAEIDKVIDYLFKSLIDNERIYFDFMEKLIKNNIQDKNGFLLLNAKDKQILPKRILDRFKTLTLSDKDVDIYGGFILQYDNVFIDCSFEALKAEKYDDMVDFFNKELFKD